MKTNSLLKLKHPGLLKGASLEAHNNFIATLLKENGVTTNTQFELDVLQTYVHQEKTFGKGLIAYLKVLENKLDQAIPNNKKLKLKVLQVLSELGSLVFPNPSACYSLVPSDLAQLDWKSILKTAQASVDEPTKQKLNVFYVDEERFGQTMRALIALSLCEVLTRAFKDDRNWVVVEENGNATVNKGNRRPRVKAGDWIHSTYVAHPNAFKRGTGKRFAKKAH